MSTQSSIEIKEKVFSPLSAFNNLLIQISAELEEIYLSSINKNLRCKNITFINQLLFENQSLTICGRVKLILVGEEIKLKFIGEFDAEKMLIIEKTMQYKDKIISLFRQYLFISATICKNFDDSISQKYVKSIFDQISNNQINPDKLFLIPYKAKIRHLYDKDEILEKLFSQYSYLIKFSRNSQQTFNYSLLRCLSSELSESKSIENIRFEDIEVIKSETLPIHKLDNFLVELFYYGELISKKE
jgi:hypothetical protein